MYLITAYFDETTNKILSKYIKRIANETGNTFMTDNNVPPHLTLTALETEDEDEAIDVMRNLEGQFESGKIKIVTIGTLLPYVIYAAPVFNDYLKNQANILNLELSRHSDISENKFYKHNNWMPHITLAKRLSSEQLIKAFAVMTDCFSITNAKIVKIGLSKVNPYRDIYTIEL